MPSKVTMKRVLVRAADATTSSGPRSLNSVDPESEPLDAVAPEVDEHLALQSVSLDDSPDFERGTLVGHG